MVPNQPSFPPPSHVLERAHGSEEGTRAYERHQVDFAEEKEYEADEAHQACVETREVWRGATRGHMVHIAVFKGKDIEGHGKGVQGVEGKDKYPKGKRQHGLSTEPCAKRQRQAT